MKNPIKLSPKQTLRLLDCISFEIPKEESDTLFGGIREYHPPIYEPNRQQERNIQTNDLLTDISQPNKNL